MVKVQDTYNPVTGEYVKRISDWQEITGTVTAENNTSANKNNLTESFKGFNSNVTIPIPSNSGGISVFKFNTKKLNTIVSGDWLNDSAYISANKLFLSASNNDTGFSEPYLPSNAEWKSYLYGWKMCNADGTSPYYKSEVPYTPATWAEWATWSGTVTRDSTGISLAQSTTVRSSTSIPTTSLKSSTKYGILYNVTSNNGFVSYYCTFGTQNASFPSLVGNNKVTYTTTADTAPTYFRISDNNYASADGVAKFKDIRIFELPTGSQIETDFNTLTADQLSAKYTFNGLCIKNWKKVTDGTGLTSTLPTATYAGYTPYKMIYQLETPEISYLTPKTAIPLYDTNTIVETNTLADCKADVTVGYKLKSGATAVAGDITAPTPDYMSAVNSVSELGDKKGIVRSPNIVTNGNFANGTTGWIGDYATLTVQDGIAKILATSITTSRIRMIENPLNLTDKYYFKFKVRTNNPSNVNRIDVRYTSSVSTALSDTNWKTVSGVGVSLGAPLSIQAIQNTFDGTTYFEIDEIMVVNLTATFGAGNEPTLAQCDILFATWQDKASTQATLPTLRKIDTVADTYNPETGVLIQRIGKKVFDGTENWYITDGAVNPDGGTEYYLPISGTVPASALQSHFTTHFSQSMATTPVLNKSRFYSFVNGTSWIGLSLPAKIYSSLSLFKAYLAQQYAKGTPVTVYYRLATPVVTTLTKTALPTYKPTTVIESDSTIKGNVSANYKLKVNATPVAGDFIASPECVNDIKDLGNSIDVVSSVGRRNLLQTSSIRNAKNVSSSSFTLDSWAVQTMDNNWVKTFLKPSTNYSMSYTVNMIEKTSSYNADGRLGQFLLYKLGAGTVIGTLTAQEYQSMENGDTKNVSRSFTTPSNLDGYIVLTYTALVKTTAKMRFENVKIEESSLSLFTPAPEDIAYNTITNGVYKTNILLSAPLRSVGNVKDRLFKDSDGKWKIERNIGEMILNGTEAWIEGTSYPNTTFYRRYRIAFAFMKTNAIKNVSHFNVIENSIWTEASQHAENDIGYLSFVVSNSLSSTVEIFKNWVTAQYNAGTPVVVQYEKAPTYETLSQELQTDLDNIPTFTEHNYVYTVTNDNLQPTLHVDYKKLSWLKSRLLLNSLKIYSRNLTDAEMIQNYKVEKERFGM